MTKAKVAVVKTALPVKPVAVGQVAAIEVDAPAKVAVPDKVDPVSPDVLVDDVLNHQSSAFSMRTVTESSRPKKLPTPSRLSSRWTKTKMAS